MNKRYVCTHIILGLCIISSSLACTYTMDKEFYLTLNGSSNYSTLTKNHKWKGIGARILRENYRAWTYDIRNCDECPPNLQYIIDPDNEKYVDTVYGTILNE